VACDSAAFEFIATPTGKTKVVEHGRAALRFWNDVVQCHGLSGVRFRRPAIRTTLIIGSKKLLL